MPKKQKIGQPCNTYFARHSGTLALSDTEIRRLFDEDRIFIHYSGEGDEDLISIDPADYLKPAAQLALRKLKEIATNGGFVWAQYRGVAFAKLGYIPANSEIEIIESKWERYRPGRVAQLKSLQFTGEYVKHVGEHELMQLRARRPRQGTLVRWGKAGKRVENYVLGVKSAETWDELIALSRRSRRASDNTTRNSMVQVSLQQSANNVQQLVE